MECVNFFLVAHKTRRGVQLRLFHYALTTSGCVAAALISHKRRKGIIIPSTVSPPWVTVNIHDVAGQFILPGVPVYGQSKVGTVMRCKWFVIHAGWCVCVFAGCLVRKRHKHISWFIKLTAGDYKCCGMLHMDSVEPIRKPRWMLGAPQGSYFRSLWMKQNEWSGISKI